MLSDSIVSVFASVQISDAQPQILTAPVVAKLLTCSTYRRYCAASPNLLRESFAQLRKYAQLMLRRIACGLGLLISKATRPSIQILHIRVFLIPWCARMPAPTATSCLSFFAFSLCFAKPKCLVFVLACARLCVVYLLRVSLPQAPRRIDRQWRTLVKDCALKTTRLFERKRAH